MTRPLRQGPSAVAQDISLLARVMKRVEEDPKRAEKDRSEIVRALKRAMTVLMNAERLKKPKL